MNNYFSTLRPTNKAKYSQDAAQLGFKIFSRFCSSISVNLHTHHNRIFDPHLHCTFKTELKIREAEEELKQSLAPHWQLDYLAPCINPKATIYYASKHHAIPIYFQ
jgi:hypothetical protein